MCYVSNYLFGNYLLTLNMFFSQRVLSVVWSKGNLGSSYYDTETSQLYLQMDVVETNDFQFLKRGNYWNRFEFTL